MHVDTSNQRPGRAAVSPRRCTMVPNDGEIICAQLSESTTTSCAVWYSSMSQWTPITKHEPGVRYHFDEGSCITVVQDLSAGVLRVRHCQPSDLIPPLWPSDLMLSPAVSSTEYGTL